MFLKGLEFFSILIFFNPNHTCCYSESKKFRGLLGPPLGAERVNLNHENETSEKSSNLLNFTRKYDKQYPKQCTLVMKNEKIPFLSEIPNKYCKKLSYHASYVQNILYHPFELCLPPSTYHKPKLLRQKFQVSFHMGGKNNSREVKPFFPRNLQGRDFSRAVFYLYLISAKIKILKSSKIENL